MLINEAADALFLNIATRDDIDLAMTKGVNYPKGLLAWADEIGIKNVLKQLEDLQQEYGEERYRPSPLLKRMLREAKHFTNGTAKKVVNKMINGDAFSKWLGIEILEVNKGYCKLKMIIRKEMTNGFDYPWWNFVFSSR